jgi:hypothetical protein
MHEEEEKDKRATDRFNIPGATIVFRKRNALGVFEFFSRPTPLFNFTKSGVCFQSEKKFHLGDLIYVDINIPNEKPLRLVGEVRWIDENINDDTCTIGAQFSAFGKGRNYNPLRALEKLRRLQQKYT